MKNIFVEKKASKRSLSLRKLIYGIGINDSEYITDYKVDGKRLRCPYYKTWMDMLNRCYSDNYQSKHPTYIGCTVTEEWHTFSVFKEWIISKKWESKELDKDVLIIGNKIYSQKTCIFV